MASFLSEKQCGAVPLGLYTQYLTVLEDTVGRPSSCYLLILRKRGVDQNPTFLKICRRRNITISYAMLSSHVIDLTMSSDGSDASDAENIIAKSRSTDSKVIHLSPSRYYVLHIMGSLRSDLVRLSKQVPNVERCLLFRCPHNPVKSPCPTQQTSPRFKLQQKLQLQSKLWPRFRRV